MIASAAAEAVTAPAQAAAPSAAATTAPTTRIDALDATRAFALVLGIVFHASLSFLPMFIGWAVMDVSTSPLVVIFVTISHSFRMEVYFLLAGFFTALSLRREGTARFIGERALRLGIPFVAGWFLLRPLLVASWTIGAASMRGDVGLIAGLRAGGESLAALPSGLLTGTHLWFLYYLILITSLVLTVRILSRGFGRWRLQSLHCADGVARWLSVSPWSLPALVLPTAGVLIFMRIWGVDTPDQSLLPHFPVLSLYGGCFVLGWLFFRQPGLMLRFGRLSADRWCWGFAGTVGVLWLGRLGMDPGHPQRALAHAGFVLAYASMMWALVSLTLGVFVRWCSRPRPTIRYVAESSYWLYLIHLPVVVLLQVALAELELTWTIKLALIVLTTFAIGLVTYDGFVRSTALGRIFNGRRRPRVLFAARR